MHNIEHADDVVDLVLRTHAWRASVAKHAASILQNIREAGQEAGISPIDPYNLQDLRKLAGDNLAVPKETTPQFLPNGSYDQIRKFPSAGEELQATARALADGLLAKINRFQPTYLPSTIEAIRKTFMGLDSPSPQTLDWLGHMEGIPTVEAARPAPVVKTTADTTQEHGCGSK